MKLLLSGALLLLLLPGASPRNLIPRARRFQGVSGTGFRTPGQRPDTTKKCDGIGVPRKVMAREEQKARLPYMEEDCRLK